MKKYTIAMVAHDAKKEVMAELVKRYSEKLSQLNLVATRTTGQNIMEKSGMPVTLLQSGPMGGDQQVGALVAEGKLEAVIFLRDPLFAQPHEPDISALMRVCDVHNTALATNLATAEAVLNQLFEKAGL
ncbi:MAG: methylglyoxal synthase [Dehalococcoidales bacterium]|jgi:methylglyoxal synthase|nr:methylglyoxal synthase [Dehalococcoidales bacterium]